MLRWTRLALLAGMLSAMMMAAGCDNNEVGTEIEPNGPAGGNNAVPPPPGENPQGLPPAGENSPGTGTAPANHP
ncbi:MAG: hypothetical protein ACK47B_18645 [Armatimonadota bacterium]